MGTMSSLDIGRFEIDYGKNEYFTDYRPLFQLADKKKVTYYYSNNHTETMYAYSKKLCYIKDRLDLLGYTIDELRKEYDHAISNRYELRNFMSFDKLAQFLKNIDITDIANNGVVWDPIPYVVYGLGYLVNNKKLSNYLPKYFRKKNYDEESYCYLPKYLLLRLLAENPKNSDLEVSWRIGAVVENGYIDWNDVEPIIPEDKRVWIVTEGSSDTKIFQRAINKLYPHVSDVFQYIDMQENYPFTGTGELTKFYKGLSKIRVLNRMIFIFDNDTEGLSKYNELKVLKGIPKNIILCHLPSLSIFDNFATIGPTGEQVANINGKAVSIECFLDLNYNGKNAIVRWGGYNDRMKQYQGSLIDKDSYAKGFTNAEIDSGKYDLTNIKILVEYLFKTIIDS